MRRKIILILLCLSLFGCSLLYPTKIPIHSIYYMTGKEQSDAVIIMLPGRGDGPEDFLKSGFIKILNESVTHPETIKGVLVLAPFLGDKDVIDEISNAGGLAKWTPGDHVAADDYQRQLWLWLKEYVKQKNGLPCLVTGWGQDDKFAYANELLAAVLPDDRAYTAPGRHDWDAWRKLFKQFLESGIMSGADKKQTYDKNQYEN